MSKNDLYLGTEHGEVRVTTGETQLDRLEKKVSELQTIVGQLQSELNNKVDKDKVISSINVSPEKIRITGDKIEINGETLIEDQALNRKGLSIKLDKEKILEALDEIIPTSLSGIEATLNKKA